MPDVPPPMDAAPADPGPALRGRLDGIVDGRVRDAQELRAAVAAANAAGYAHLDLQIDGPRFSVLPDDAEVPPERMTDERRRGLADGLGRIVVAAEGHVESTLRCTEVFRDSVRETLFSFGDDGLRAITRSRAPTPEDRGAVADAPEAPSGGRGRMTVVVLVLLVALAVIAWSGGWIDRMLSAGSTTLATDAGPFGGTLAGSVRDSWGDYEVVLRRGPAYPVTREEVSALEAAATTPEARAAVTAITTGGQVWLRLEDANGRGLAAVRVELRPLVAGAGRQVEARLPGRMSAARVRLSIDAGPEFERR